MSRIPADDAALHLAVDFCNTHDVLADPPDQLTVRIVRRLAERHGLDSLTRGLSDGEDGPDLTQLRAVRDRLYGVFAAGSAEAKTSAVNDLLAGQSAQALVVTDRGGRPRLGAVGGSGPVGRLAVVLADAMARVITDGGADRLRTCVADPCRCVYVDRTRAGRQRFCCELCNDRIASAAYRRRQA